MSVATLTLFNSREPCCSAVREENPTILAAVPTENAMYRVKARRSQASLTTIT
jgi:hypothetical protein